MTDNDSLESVKSLIQAIEKYGTVKHYHFRPARDCLLAGFWYTLGGSIAVGFVFMVKSSIAVAVGFISGWLS